MILVDTSILIDFFRQSNNSQSSHNEKFEQIIKNNIPFGITYYTYQELLQGTKTEKEFTLLDTYLKTQKFYELLYGIDSFKAAAQLNFLCRRKGVTIRSTIDLIIAQIAIENNVFLFHNDRDFDNIQRVTENLRIF